MREFSAAEDEESFHVFYPGEDEPVIIAKFGLEPDVAAQIRSRVVPDDAPGHNEGDIVSDVPDRSASARRAVIDAKKAEIAAQQAALDDQLVGLDAMAQDDAYEEVPTESESEAMAGADQERAMMDAAAARERELAASRAEGSADADAALISRSDAIERKRDQDKANIAWLDNQNAEIAARNAAAADADRQRAENAAASIGAPAPAMVESDAAYAARQNEAFADKYNKENPSWRNSPAVGAPTYAVTTLGGSGNRSDAYLTDERADYDPLGRIIPAVKGAVGALGEFAQDIGLVRPAGAGAQAALSAFGRGAPPADTSLSPEEQAMAQRSRGGREAGKFEAFRTQAAAVPGVAPAGSAGVGAGMGVKQSSERGGAWRESDGIGTMPVDQAQLERDARAAVLANLAGEADKAAKDRDIAVQEQFLKDKAMLEQQNAADIARRDIEAKEMKRQIMEGKIDPTRLFSSMDGGRQAVTLISMVLGGLANGASGFRTGNVAVDMFDRMIDRDIAAQKDGLDRKQSMYRDFIQEGRDAQQSFLLTKAAMQEGLAAQLRLNASKLGSETAMVNAEQAAIKIENEAKANRDKAANDWTKIELDKRMTAAQIAKMRSDAQRQKEMTAIDYMNAETARARVGGGAAGGAPGKNPPMEIAPGVIVQPSDPTSRQNLEKAVDAFNTMRNLIVEARAHRAKHGAQFIPRTDAYVKANRLEKQLITALNNVENLGAFDRGTADLLGQIVPTVGGVYTPGVVDSSLAELLDLAEKKFKTKVMTNVVPGTGLVTFTGSQQGDFKPVGKAD